LLRSESKIIESQEQEKYINHKVFTFKSENGAYYDISVSVKIVCQNFGFRLFQFNSIKKKVQYENTAIH